MRRRTVGLAVVIAGCALILSGGMAFAEDEPPLPPVPAEYADKHMPAGGWTDPKAIEEGALIYIGEANPQINCASCHGKDGKPVKKGARDLRDPKNATRFSDSYWFWRVSEGVPKTKMKAWKSMLSEQQIWQVIAYQHQFSHDGKPSEHNDYKP
ncbi:MAG TPA: cytochrome c [Nitrospira sp.]|nr:cytochrome c [Nitrospira sp.]